MDMDSKEIQAITEAIQAAEFKNVDDPRFNTKLQSLADATWSFILDTAAHKGIPVVKLPLSVAPVPDGSEPIGDRLKALIADILVGMIPVS